MLLERREHKMAGPMPHSKQIEEFSLDYLVTCKNEWTKQTNSIKSSIGFRKIYKTSLSTSIVFSQFTRVSLNPRISSVLSLTTHMPALIVMGQALAFQLFLRQLIELTFWTIFFSDHPREWDEFCTSPNAGYCRTLENPISYLAHRELGFYVNYAREYFQSEPSAEAIKAIEALDRLRAVLNAVIHPGSIAISLDLKNSVIDKISTEDLDKLSLLQRECLANASLLICAFSVKKFNHFSASARAHFDDLIGKTRAKKLRSGAFGLTKGV
jgi:hypothetical protein